MRIGPFEILKSNELIDLKRKIEEIKVNTERPGLPAWEVTGSDETKFPRLNVSLNTLYDVAEQSDILTTIFNTHKGAVFRKGIEVKEKFTQKCMLCQKEFKTFKEDFECDVCHSKLYIEPSSKNKKKLEELRDNVNKNKQSMEEVLKLVEDDLNICDNNYIVFSYSYTFDMAGNMLEKALVEIIRADPRVFEVVANKSGSRGINDKGEEVKFCLAHRTFSSTTSDACGTCGRKLVPAFFKAKMQSTDSTYNYFTDWEILQKPRNRPGLLFGYPPMVCCWQKVICLLEMDRQIKLYYTKGRSPRGLMFMRGTVQSVEKAWKWVMEEFRKNPNQIAPLPVDDPKGRSMAEFIDLMRTPEEMQFMEMRREFREAIAAVYGVQPMFINHMEGAGGLNNEGLQFTATQLSVEERIAYYNRWVLPRFTEAMGVTDYIYEIPPVEVMDEMTKLKIENQKILNAQGMKSMGFEVSLNEEKEFEYSDEPEAFDIRSMMNQPVTQPMASNQNNQKFGGEPESVMKSEGTISTSTPGAFFPTFNKKKRLMNVAEAIMKSKGFEVKKDLSSFVPLMASVIWDKKFDGLTRASSEILKNMIIKGLEVGRTPFELTRDIIVKEEFHNLSMQDIERIVQTEYTALQNAVVEEAYRDSDPEQKMKYRWVSIHDKRRTSICENISNRTAEGVTMETLKKIVREESIRGGFDGSRELCPHQNCRSSFSRTGG